MPYLKDFLGAISFSEQDEIRYMEARGPLFTKRILEKLRALPVENNVAVCRIFSSLGNATWIIFSQEPEPNADILWCVADLGLGFVEYGTVGRSELESIWFLERDKLFEPGKPIEHYLRRASLPVIV